MTKILDKMTTDLDLSIQRRLQGRIEALIVYKMKELLRGERRKGPKNLWPRACWGR